MKTMTVGELKAQFSEVLAAITRNGEPVAISYGKKKDKVAAIIPYHQLQAKTPRRLGLMQGKATCIIHADVKIDDETLLGA